MTTDADSTVFSEFLDDYFAECDEHLAHVRHILLELETQTETDETAIASALSELLRRFHTIKGLSMMVGFAEAGKLSHELESLLRKLQARQTPLTSETIGILADAVRSVEQTIASHKRGEKPRSITAIMKKLSSLGEEEPPVPAKGTPRAEYPGNVATFEFLPSPELAAQGVNVQVVREALERRGRVLAVEPTVRPQGQVAFVFTVEMSGNEKAVEDLRQLGLVPVDTEAPETRAVNTRPSAAEPATPTEATRPDVATRAAEAVPSLAPSTVVRVELARLDELMNMCGELILARNRLDSSLHSLRDRLDIQAWRLLEQHSELLERQIRTLRQAVMRVRMVPMAELFGRLRFAAYDLAREQKKKIQVLVEGGETEVDKLVVERILDPLLHLVRNAVTHGLEPPEERLQAGKPEQGILRLRAAALGELLLISVADDGAGLNLAEIRARAVASGLVGPDEVLDVGVALEIISSSGFSTRSSADLAGGRGVGMTIVKQTVEALGGEIALSSHPGMGTEFVLQLPLTLAIMEAVLVRAGQQVFAVPLLALREVVEVETERVVSFPGGEMMAYRGGVLPLLHLTTVFGLTPGTGTRRYALVTGSETQPVGLVVEKVLEQKEIVVAPISDPLVRVPGVAGATQLGDGSLVLILDPPRLARLVARMEREWRVNPDTDSQARR